jgi:hypothetical protein
MSPLAHFAPAINDDIIYANLVEVEFINKKTSTDIPILTKQLYKIEGNKMYFNFNYYKLNPLKDIADLMSDKTSLTVNVLFHDKEGMVIYKVELKEFKFVDVLNIMDYDRHKHFEIKELIVEFDYKEKNIKTFI